MRGQCSAGDRWIHASSPCFALGGKGNYYFLSNMNRAPTEYELGASGDNKDYKLELQLIAHFGLVGCFLLTMDTDRAASSFLLRNSSAFPTRARAAFCERFPERDLSLVTTNLPRGNLNSARSNTMISSRFMVRSIDRHAFDLILLSLL